MKPILRPFYVFALNTNEPREDHILLHEKLTKSQFKTLQGMYKGESETSYLVDADFKNLALKLAKEYNQESILFIDETREAYLIYMNNSAEKVHIGSFQATKSVKGHDAYTIDLETNKAYIVA